GPIPSPPETANVRCRSPAQVNRPRFLFQRYPVREFCVEGAQGNAIAHSHFNIRAKPQLVDDGTESEVATKIKLVGLRTDTGANSGAVLAFRGSGKESGHADCGNPQ